MNRDKLLVGVACAALLLAGCTAAPSSGVPSLNGGGGGSATVAGHGSQAQALHAAAQCIRDHGVRNYQDPVVAPDGSVYTDQRSLQEASRDNRAFFDPIRTACASLFQTADFNPMSEPKATPALVQAGVRAAQCMRAHNLPNYRDPTASTAFVPGHGFSLTPDQLPAGGKTNAVVQQAVQACRSQLDAELRASSLASLSHG